MRNKYINSVCGIIIMFFLVASSGIFISGCSAVGNEDRGNNYQPPMDYNIDELQQYGRWVQIAQYGQVWQPSVVSDWEPFHNGHWINSDNKWTWVSYEPFGWVVYHYGCWYDDPVYGWVWIPENNGWSPATVEWRQFDNYVAWSPLAPRGVIYKEPWEETTPRHWHTVNSNSFLKDNVGKLQEAHPQYRGNTGDRVRTSQPSQPKDNGTRISIERKSPIPRDFENKTGQKVTNTPITRERVRTKSSNIDRITLPDSERKRVEKNQKDVQQKVLVPKTGRNIPVQGNEKKEERKRGE